MRFLFTVQNASRLLGGVDDKVQEADRLRNITANLQAQLRQNMSALEEKLRRAREYVAKVKRLISYERSVKGFFKISFSLLSHKLDCNQEFSGSCSANQM